MFGGTFAPQGWATCDGQLLSISQNTALFSLLGTTYGGNGQTTFALPDLRGRVAVHAGQGPGLTPYVLGEQTGTENHTLLVTQMPAHNHVVNADSGSAASTNPTNALPGNPGFGKQPNYYSSATANATMNQTMVGITGGSQPFSVIQPLLCLNFIIALVGIYPSRN